MNNGESLTPADDFGPRLFAQMDYARALASIPEAAYLPAYNLSAIPELMRRVGGLADLRSLARLAVDPNTPAEALVFLAGICPAEFCANPALPLLLLENPALPAQFDPPSLGRLLSYGAVPEDLLAAVAHMGQPAMAHAAREHVGLAGELEGDLGPAVAAAVTGLTSVPDDSLLALLLRLDLVPPWLRPRAEAATGAWQSAGVTPRHPILQADVAGPEDLARLLEHASPRERARAAADPRTPPHLLARARDEEERTDGDYGVYEALACNPSTPAATLAALAADRIALATGVRRAVAHNPSAPPEALALLEEEYYALDIPLALAAHGNLGAEQRARMAATALERARDDYDPFYRAIALSRPDAPTALLAAQARSPYWLERLAVALGPATPAEARRLLAEDGHRLVRAAARRAGPPTDDPDFRPPAV